jgi:hypothetical protein
MISPIICLLFPLSFAALLGNYKLWDSRGGSLYDYSGNGRHAILDSSNGLGPILTDRGQYLYSRTSIRFPSNSYTNYPGGSTLLISFWFLAKENGNLLNIYSTNSGTSKSIEIGWTRASDGVSGAIFHRHSGYTEINTYLTYSKIYFRCMESLNSGIY